jgi:hypothetical protein
LDQNRFGNTLQIMNHIIVRNSEDSQTKVFEMVCAGGIICLAPFMTFTVKFDDEVRGRTIEINYVRFDRMLPTELKTAELASTQDCPETLFGIRGIATKSDRAGARMVSYAF